MIFCGDLNVAHKEIDLKNPKTNRKNAGFTDEEREKFSVLLREWIYRYLPVFLSGFERCLFLVVLSVPAPGRKNAGWRIDYFVVSEALKGRLKDAKIHTEILGSDHCPVELDMQE